MVSRKKKSPGWVRLITSDVLHSSFTASMNIFSNIPLCLVGGVAGQYLGRKTVCYLVSPIFLAGFLCVALAPDLGLLLFGRVLGGIGHGLVTTSAGVSPRTRDGGLQLS